MNPTLGAAARSLSSPLLMSERAADDDGRCGLHLHLDKCMPSLAASATITVRLTTLALLLTLTAVAGYTLGCARSAGLPAFHSAIGASLEVPSLSFALVEHAATMCCSFFFLSPMVQMAQVYASKGEALDGVNPQTIILMLFNCALWASWGVYAPMWPAVPANALGFMAAAFYLALCWAYAAFGRSKSCTWGHHAALGTAAAVVLVVAFYLYARTSHEHAEQVGYVAMVICVALFASPLSVLRRVIAERSSALLPPFQCAMQFLNCFLWVLVGAHAGSVQMLVCNGLGLGLAAVQLGLILAFPAGGREDVDVLP